MRVRWLAIGLVVGLLVATSGAAGARAACKPASGWFDPVEGPATRINDAATEENPVEISFAHDPSGGALIARQLADLEYFPIQVATKKSSAMLHLRLEWATPSVDEIDLFLQTNDGEYVAAADGANVPLPEEDLPEGAGLSPMGYEYIPGHPVGNCDGF